MKKRKKIYAAIGFLALFFILLIGYFYSRYQYFISNPVNSYSDEEMSFIIKKGDNTGEIALSLAQKKLILDSESFKWYAKLNSLDNKIKSGRFLLSQNQTIPEILETLTNNEKRQIIVTIPEGATINEIDQKLSELELIKSEDFKKAVQNFSEFSKYPFINEAKAKDLIYPLEGYLFPDTYFINADEFSSEQFISMMLNNFKKKIASLNLEKSEYSLDQIINVAAMVEKEANQDKDRPVVAEIIWKRLEQKWQLGIDATSLYLKEDRNLDHTDLREDSPYNTRLNRGLPPGPIANPGLKSISAAAFPEKNDYMYYLTSRKGEMFYAKTLNEHNYNKAKYL